MCGKDIKMHKIIFDCDNTMGIYGCDVDDGLTLLYLLGRDDVDLIGLTTTYGNNKLENVYNNTRKIFNELSIKDIPLLKGAYDTSNRISEASKFLVDKINEFPNQITILATGSLTNLLGAYELDNAFFDKVKEIVLMGGITETLIINGKVMNELNFSCDAEAVKCVFSSKAKITILNAHICLQAFFGQNELKRLNNSDLKIFEYIKSKTLPWVEFIMKDYGTDGFNNWDIVASVFITHPELFENNFVHINSSVEDLETGMLICDKNKNSNINMPLIIKDVDKFNDLIFEAWSKVSV